MAKSPSRLKKPRVPIDVVTKKIPNSVVIKAYLNVKMLEAAAITSEIVRTVSASVRNAGKTPNAAALANWRSPLQKAVYSRLVQGGNWSADRTKVLKVATDMGTIAALLSGKNKSAGKNQLQGAFTAAKSHVTCSSGGVGGGDWCTFSWT